MASPHERSVPSLPASEPSGLLATVGSYIQMARRQTFSIAATTAAALAICAVYLVARVPTYTATTVLLIDTRKVRAVQDAYAFTAQGEAFDTHLASQIEVLRSPRITQWVLDKLPTDIGVDAANDGAGPISNILAQILYPLGIGADDPRRAGELTAAQQRRILGRQIAEGLAVKRLGRTQLVEISYTGLDPVRAARIANAFGDAYMAEQADAQVEAATRATTWLRGQLDDLKGAVQRSEMAVQRFKADRGLVSASGRLVEDQKLSDLTTQMSSLKAETLRLEARYAKVKEALSSNRLDPAILEAIGSSAVEQNRARYLVAERGERDISRRLGPGHATAQRLRAEMQDFHKLTLQELNRLAEGLRNEFDIAKAREKSAGDQYRGLVGTNSAANETMVELRELERTSDSFKAIYASALQRNQEAVQQQSFAATDIRVIGRAAPPVGTSGPSPFKSLLYSLLLGAMGGVGIGALRELLDDTFRTRRGTGQLLGVAAVHQLPRLTPGKAAADDAVPGEAPHEGPLLDHVIAHPRSQFAETLQAVKVTLMGQPPEPPARVIGVVSVMPGEGTTTIAQNLAAALAQMGSKALLIDADLRDPTLTRALAPDAGRGVQEAIAEGRAGAGMVIRQAGSGLDLLPAAGADRITAPVGLLTSPGFAKLLKQASIDYDYVILDLPSLAACSDADAIAGSLDGFLLVVEWGKTTKRQTADILREHEAVQAKCLAVALNKIDWPRLQRYEPFDAPSNYLRRYDAFRAGKRPAA